MNHIVKDLLHNKQAREAQEFENNRNKVILDLYKLFVGTNEVGEGQQMIRNVIGENILAGIKTSDPGSKGVPGGLQGVGGI